MNVKPGLSKMEPINIAEVFRQPVFGNPLITNQDSRPLGLSGRSEGNALVNASHSRVGDFWDLEAKTWKNLSALGMSSHANNRLNRDLIIASIPWDPATSNNKPLIGDWVSVVTPLWPSVGVKPNTSKVGDLESSGTPECLELDNKAENTSH
jgi:hypothetical protein